MKNRLRVLRAEKGWTQAELAERLGVSRQAVNALETEKHDPSLDLAYRIAAQVGAAVEEGDHPPAHVHDLQPLGGLGRINRAEHGQDVRRPT